jgi:tRNA threonylcarbamoyladenosine biosynthesis protein TsaB
MLTLLVETSTERGLIALADGKQVLSSRTLELPLNQAKMLFPAIQELLRERHVAPAEIRCVGVGIGPGSYTGIRIGVTVAKVMAFSQNIPLVGLCSLELLVPSGEEQPFAAVIDARIGGVYVLLAEPKLVALDAVGEMLQGIPKLVSPNVTPIKRRMEEAYPAMQWQWEECGPRADIMAALVQQHYALGQFSLDGQLELLYLRKTQAEIERA